MAYFRCSTGSTSSGDGVALIVQCDASFAGSTITADNGEDVFAEICPSVSPYTVRFEGIPTGTYTISGVTEGQTVSKTFVVSDYNFEFHGTPTGSTATPVNVIQTWLHCADIWDKTYTTIDQVLADTSTLLALISSNNASDYMARSTSWASSVCANQTAMGYIGNNDYCANTLLADSTWLNAICNSTYFENVLNVKVPTMTSNTTPSGVASASSSYSDASLTSYPYQAFAGGDSRWVSRGGASFPQWIQYQFTSAVTVKCLYMNYGYHNSQDWEISSFKLQGSNDGSHYDDLATITNDRSSEKQKYAIDNNNSYLYYRVYILATFGNKYTALGCNFYGRA